MVWYSHLFQNFPQFIVIHTVKAASVLTFDEWGADNIKPLNTVSFVNGNIENSSITGIKPAFVDQINKMLEMLQKEGIQLDMPLDEIQKAVKKI